MSIDLPSAPQPSGSPGHRSYPWRLFFLLLAGAVVGVFALLPYLTVLLSPTLSAHPLPLPLPVIVGLQAVTNFSVAIGVGLLLAPKVGLGAPLLESWLYRTKRFAFGSTAIISVSVGAALGFVILLLLRSPLGSVLSAMPLSTESAMPLWKRFLACFYGGLDEEILMRLFLLSFVIWLFRLIGRGAAASRATAVFWASNLLVALAFGAGHLPLAARLAPLVPSLVAMVISLNAIAALGFGYLYWKRGLEAAILAHFCADIVLHVFGPFLA